MHVHRSQKIYLTRAQTRAMKAEFPIGDPHGGAAYGEYNDPVSAIISIGSMLATGGAVMAGTATLMQGLMFAGAAISLVGNATGNSTLMKIGMVTGLAGGVGALAESAGMFTSGTLGETFGYGANAANAAAPAAGIPGEIASATPGAVPEALAVQTQPTMIGPEAISTGPAPIELASAGATPSPVPSQFTPSFSGAPAGAELTAAQPSAAQQFVGDIGAGQVATPVSAPTIGAPTAPGAPSIYDLTTAPGAPGAPGLSVGPGPGLQVNPGQGLNLSSAGRAAPGFMDSLQAGNFGDAAMAAGRNVMDLAKSNPGAAYMLGSAVSSAADVLSGKTEAQIDALEAQGELSKAQADKLRYEVQLAKDRRANLNRNYANVQNPLANWRPTFQVVPPSQQPGLIAGAMPPPAQPAPGG